MELLTGYGVFDWIAKWANPPCDTLFRVATDLGHHALYYLVIAILFWAIDRRRAAILFLLLLASGYVNTFVKLWAHSARPDPSLVRILDFRPYQEASGAFPSGHAQGAVVFWGYLSQWVGQGWFALLGMFLIVLVSFSRLYLGVHFPIDILGGLALGASMLWFVGPILERWSRTNFQTGVAGALLIVGGSLALTLASRNLALALTSGSLVGFFIAVVWLPQMPLDLHSARESSVGATGGALFTLVVLSVAGLFPQTPLTIYTEVAVVWCVALWVYPQLLHRVWLARAVPPTAPDAPFE